MGLKTTAAWACVAAMLATSMPATAAPLGFQAAQIDVKNAQLVEVGHRGRRWRRHRRRSHHHHNDGAIALGIIGLAAGLAIAGSHDRRHVRSCPAPWSRSWYRSCSRFRTFDPDTGYYFDRPGHQRFCEC